MASAVEGATTYGFTYNGLGDRLRQTVNGTPTSYTLDLAAGLTEVLSDGVNAYLYGNGRVGEEQGAGWVYHLGDALGSVRQLADPAGAVAMARSYEPFGEVISSTGTRTSNFQYSGQQVDGTGLVFLRARYMEPAVGRFLSRDVWEGDARRPLSYNVWLYTYANPVNFEDPTGAVPFGPLVRFLTSDENAPEWRSSEALTIYQAAWHVARAYAAAYSEEMVRRQVDLCLMPLSMNDLPWLQTPHGAFLTLHGGPIAFRRMSERANGYWAEARSSREVWVFANARVEDIAGNHRFIAHEIGHAFENALLGTLGARLGREALPQVLRHRRIEGTQYGGFAGEFKEWQFSTEETTGEIFADMFVGWVYGGWESDRAGVGSHRESYMHANMGRWIADAIAVREGRRR